MAEVLKAPFPVGKVVVFRGDELPGYSVFSDGRIWSCLTGKFLRPYNVAKGYAGVALRNDGATIRATIHTLVAEAYIGARPVGFDVCHLDGNPANNDVRNLRYASRSDNIADKILHGTSQHGERNPSAKLTNVQAEEVRIRRKAGERLADIATDYMVAVSCISRIASGARRAVG